MVRMLVVFALVVAVANGMYPQSSRLLAADTPSAEALSSPDAAVRAQAARAVGALGDKARGSAPALVKLLGDANVEVRAYSAQSLGLIGDSSTATVEALAARTLDDDAQVRSAALKALQNLKLPRAVAIPLFIKVLSHADSAHVQPALHSLAQAGAEAVPFLADCLKHKDAAYYASLVLAEIGPEAKDAVPGLIDLLSSADPEVRLQAAVALGEIGPAAAKSTAAITKLLTSDPLTGVRYAAAYSIGKVGARDPGAEAALEAGVSGSDSFLSEISAWALARLKPTDAATVERAVKLLVAGLKHEDKHVRQAAARALGELQVADEKIVPELLSALSDADPTVASNVVDALASRGSAAVPRLVQAIESPKLRLFAIRIAGRIGPDAAGTVPALVQAMATAEPSLRREIQFTLGAIGPAAAPAVPELVKSLTSSDEPVRNSALFALGRIGASARAAVPELERLSQSSDPFAKLASLWALIQIQPPTPELAARAIPELLRGLDDERELLRMEVVETLGKLGPIAAPALPLLRTASENDPSPWVRKAAAKAVTKISSSGSPAPQLPPGPPGLPPGPPRR